MKIKLIKEGTAIISDKDSKFCSTDCPNLGEFHEEGVWVCFFFNNTSLDYVEDKDTFLRCESCVKQGG